MILIGFFSCKKDRLKDEKEVLVGVWRWEYSVRDNNPGTNSLPHYIDTITPLTEGDTYKMEFCKNGKVHFYKNGQVTEKRRIVFRSWNSENNIANKFEIMLDNDQSKILGGDFNFVNEDLIRDSLAVLFYFPFSERDENCDPSYFDCSKTNIFVKE
jgi:hypothetical protein